MGEVGQAIHGGGAVCLTSPLLSRQPLTMSVETKTEIKPRTRRIEGLMAHERFKHVIDIDI